MPFTILYTLCLSIFMPFYFLTFFAFLLFPFPYCTLISMAAGRVRSMPSGPMAVTPEM